MADKPMPLQARQNSGSGIALYGQRLTDCLRRVGFTPSPGLRPGSALGSLGIARLARAAAAPRNLRRSIRTPGSSDTDSSPRYRRTAAAADRARRRNA